MILRRYIYGAAAVAAIAAFLWYRAALIEDGRQSCRAEVEAAIDMQRAIADQQSLEYESQRAERQIEYRDRVREVVKYVPTDNHDCDWSPHAQRVFKSAIDAANAAR